MNHKEKRAAKNLKIDSYKKTIHELFFKEFIPGRKWGEVIAILKKKVTSLIVKNQNDSTLIMIAFREFTADIERLFPEVIK